MDELWTLLCVISFWGWIVAVVGMIVFAFPGKNSFAWAPAARWGTAVLFCFALWITAMTQA